MYFSTALAGCTDVIISFLMGFKQKDLGPIQGASYFILTYFVPEGSAGTHSVLYFLRTLLTFPNDRSACAGWQGWGEVPPHRGHQAPDLLRIPWS